MERILGRAGWITTTVLALLLVAALAGVVRGGPLDPPSAPGSTQEMQINSLPYTITTRTLATNWMGSQSTVTVTP